MVKMFDKIPFAYVKNIQAVVIGSYVYFIAIYMQVPTLLYTNGFLDFC